MMQVDIPFVEVDDEIQRANNRKGLFATVIELFLPPQKVDTSIDGEILLRKAAGCIAIHPRRSVLALSCATRKDCRVGEIYVLAQNEWLSPPLTHTSQEDGVFCLVWMPFSDVLLVGNSTGIGIWSILALHEKEIDKSWLALIEHPAKRPIHSIEVCPTGRLAAALSVDTHEILIFDCLLGTANSLFCSSGTKCQEIVWTHSGKFILTGTHAGELVLFDTDNWERNDSNIYEVEKPIYRLCWLDHALCLVLGERSLQLHTYFTRGGNAATGGQGGSISAMRDQGASLIQNFPVVMSIVPYELPLKIFEQLLKSRNVSRDHLFVFDIQSDISSRLVAVTVAYTSGDSGDIHVIPAVGLYLCSTDPELSMLPIRLLTMQEQSDSSPVHFGFRSTQNSYHKTNKFSESGSHASKSSSRRYGTVSRSIQNEADPLKGQDVLGRAGAPVIVIMWTCGAVTMHDCSL